MPQQTQREKILKVATEILEEFSQGIRYEQLRKKITERDQALNENTIVGVLNDARSRKRVGIDRPEKGLYVLSKYLNNGTVGGVADDEIRQDQAEIDFYQPFVDFLINDLGECTKAIALGGNVFGDRWGTPDVLGVYKFSNIDPVKPPIEIISAEIKLDINQMITAFGQAVAYKLFSHKVYLVIPSNIGERDLGRIESLCLKTGIGLILFNVRDSNNPNWTIRARAVKSDPDYFYSNDYLIRIRERLSDLGLD